MQEPTVSTLTDPDWRDVIVVLDEKIARDPISELKRLGAQPPSRCPSTR